jgi:predicted PurR-regulated permease PerM
MAAKEKNQTESNNQLSPLTRNVLTFVIALGILLLLWAIIALKSLFVLILISIVFASGLAPGMLWLQKLRLPRGRRIPRGLAILLIYIFAFVIILLSSIETFENREIISYPYWLEFKSVIMQSVLTFIALDRFLKMFIDEWRSIKNDVVNLCKTFRNTKDINQ